MQETVFKRAKNYYDNCELIIKELCDITKDFAEPIDFDGAVTDFDVMMLSLLFCQAIADDDFCENEKDFIKALPNADNYFTYFVSKDLTWDKVFAMSTEEQKELSKELLELLNSSANSFALKFAMLDAVSTQSYISEIALNLSQIGLLLSMVDGEITADELNTFHEYTQELIVGKWIYYVEAFTKSFEEMKEKQSKESTEEN